MSYILEALEKSEKERKQKSVPDLQTQHTEYPGVSHSRSRRTRKTPRRIGPAVLVAVLFMATAWLFREHIPVALEIKITREPAQNIDFAKTRAAPSDPSLQEDQPQLSQKTTMNGEAEAPATKPASTTAQKQVPAVTPAADILASDVTEQPEEIVAPPVAPGADNEEQTVIARNRITLQPAPIILKDNDSTSTVTVPALPFFEELPASVQGDLPKLKCAGHTYSAIPQDRLIIINSSIKREGDPVAPGLRLEEITWEGVIFNFRGLRFQMITTSL